AGSHVHAHLHEARAARADLYVDDAGAAHEVARPRGVRGAARARVGLEVRAGVEAAAPAAEVAEHLVCGAADELAASGGGGRVDRLVEGEPPRTRHAAGA